MKICVSCKPVVGLELVAAAVAARLWWDNMVGSLEIAKLQGKQLLSITDECYLHSTANLHYVNVQTFYELYDN